MNIAKICTTIATFGPVGYFGASGTVATIFTLPFVYMLQAQFPIPQQYGMVIAILYFISILIIKQALHQLRRHDDPSEIVLDEVIGCLLVFWGIRLLPKTIMVGCLLFRTFDIIKFGWVKRAESWANAWGIMGDDMIAALLTNGILRLLFN